MNSNTKDSVEISISVKSLEIPGCKELRVLYTVPGGNIIIAKVKPKDLSILIASSNIIFINEIIHPREELTTGAYDLSLNRVNYVHARLPQINGLGLAASVKERLFDTLDIDLKSRVFTTGMEAQFQTSHASLMATMIAGGANSSPFAQGIAWRSGITSSSFENLFPDPDSIFQQRSISVQNHSYGTIVESFYGNEAFAYDQQANLLPGLLHVFSSGNAGNSTSTSGNYAGIPQFANLTGNFKQAKNILTVGSLDSAGQLMPLSSRGPAYDGRIKPELMAYGEDGSSGAAATVSGVALLLQHAYRIIHNDLPASSLVKAILLNSADDISNPHPDYLSGFGSLNAYRAVQTILDGRYYENKVSQNEIKSFSIQVPAGISKLKITLSWNDPAAVPNAGKALVNDLDLQLINNSTAETWLPWVLDHTPSTASLQSIAQRKTDTLNNNEQVTLDNPSPGMYSIEVKGSKITSSDQAFSIAWQTDTTNQMYWTYPTGSDPMIASNIHWLRWETNLQGPAQLEYSTNGIWNPIGSVADVSQKYFRWLLPDTVTTAVLRLVHASGTILSDTITISHQPEMRVGFNCTDSFLLYWNQVSPSYELYQLESQFLEPFLQTGDTSVLLDKSHHPSLYYSVAPIINGRRGARSYTINYPALGPSCYINAFYLQTQTPSSAVFTVELGTLYGISEISLEKRTASGFVVRQTITDPQDLIFQVPDDLLNQGENYYRVKLTLDNGDLLYSDVEIVYHWPVHPVVVYPNPVIQNSMLKVISNESGRYSLQVFDNSGKLIWEQLLVSTVTGINTGQFAKGLYIIRITGRDGKPFVQKLMIY